MSVLDDYGVVVQLVAHVVVLGVWVAREVRPVLNDKVVVHVPTRGYGVEVADANTPYFRFLIDITFHKAF